VNPSNRLLSPIEKSVQERVRDWRAIKGTKSMPEELWKDVAALVPGTTVNRISKMMGLNHTVLKRHYHEWKARTTAFVEFTAVDSPSNAVVEHKPSDTTIEIVLGNGCQVTIRQQSSYESAGNLFSTVWKEIQCSR
jgi:hypothetical protein